VEGTNALPRFPKLLQKSGEWAGKIAANIDKRNHFHNSRGTDRNQRDDYGVGVGLILRRGDRVGSEM
jgi:hypothetical protein